MSLSGSHISALAPCTGLWGSCLHEIQEACRGSDTSQAGLKLTGIKLSGITLLEVMGACLGPGSWAVRCQESTSVIIRARGTMRYQEAEGKMRL